MTNEELCLRYQAGDAGAAEELISRNMGLIRSIAIRYAHDYQNVRMDADDYTQEGAVALLRATSQYDPSREVQFLTYAGRAVRNAIIDAIRADNPNLVLTPLEEAQTGSGPYTFGKNNWRNYTLRSVRFLRAIMPGSFADMASMMMYINPWRK